MNPIRLRRSLSKPLLVSAALLLAATHAADAASLVPPASGPCSLEIHRTRDDRQDRGKSRRRTRRRPHPHPGRARSAARYGGPSAPRRRCAGKARAMAEGSEIAVRALADKPNRFGHVPARLFAAPPSAQHTASGGEIGIAEAILDAASRAIARTPPPIPAATCCSPRRRK